MKPRKIKSLIMLIVMTGFVLTQACGSSSGTSTTASNTGNTSGVTITNEVSSPAEMNVGDIIMSQFGLSGEAQIDFSGVDSNSQYYLAVGSLDYLFGTHSFSIQSALADISPVAEKGMIGDEEDMDDWSAADAFHQRLDDMGLMLALDSEVEIADPGFAGAKAAAPDFALAVGDTEEFRVLNSLTSLNSYANVTGRVRCIADNVIMYVDVEVEAVNPRDLTDEDIQQLCINFNNEVIFERSLYGSESDVNGDGKVAALLTPQVNRLGALGGGIITGFVIASDYFARTGSNPISNEREIIYTLVPDSAGNYGLVIPKVFGVENLLNGVLPHEMQHVISYNQHVFEGEGTPEASWLNEAMSHLSEDLVGFGQENYSRMNIFLNDPTTYQLVASGSPNLGERGASYLFMRFLYEQHPDPVAFLRGLYSNNKNGVANVEVAFAGTAENFDQFGEFFMRWMTAMAMTNRGLSADTRYVYRPRTFNADTNRWQGVCLICDAEDGRGTVLSGISLNNYDGSEAVSLYSSSMEFYDVSSVPDTITLSGSSSSTLGAVLIRKQ